MKRTLQINEKYVSARPAAQSFSAIATAGSVWFVSFLDRPASNPWGGRAPIPAAIEERQILTFQDLQNVPPADLCSVRPRLTPSGPEKVSLGPKNLIAKRTE